MNDRIEWVRSSCQLLARIGREFEQTQPFRGLTIGTGIHLEPKTVALILVLQQGGAEVVATGNLNTTQPAAVDYVRARGIKVIGQPTSDPDQHGSYQRQVLAEKPDLLLDNGGDLFDLFRQNRYDGLLGGSEETTSGRMRLAPLRDELRMPILVINDSPIKQFAENEHAVGQSVLESYMRITNRVTNGQCVTVFGYGACGRGVAANFKAAHSRVSVIDRDPVKRLQAHLDGYATPARDAAVASADLIVTVTGAPRVLDARDLLLFKDRVLLVNAGHFPWEIDRAALIGNPTTLEAKRTGDGIESLRLTNGRVVHLLAEGHMVNLAGPRPLGNSIESMDLGFALQARCLEAVARGEATADACVVPVPRAIDERVAAAYLDLCYPPGSAGP